MTHPIPTPDPPRAGVPLHGVAGGRGPLLVATEQPVVEQRAVGLVVDGEHLDLGMVIRELEDPLHHYAALGG